MFKNKNVLLNDDALLYFEFWSRPVVDDDTTLCYTLNVC